MTDNPSRLSRDSRPPMTSFTPSMWGEVFTSFALDHQAQDAYAQAIEELKKKVATMLMAAASSQLLVLVDTLERLGLAYHFEEQIEGKMSEIHEFYSHGEDAIDLFNTALAFRLLRQHQYHVSCDIFDKFMDKEHKFKETLISDVEGLLSLYEVAHVRIHGEDVLDEAVVFTTLHLTSMAPQLKSTLKDKVTYALEQPLHRSIPISNIRSYIPIYESGDSKDELLLKFAKVNFNYLQNLYKKELCELSRWWQKFDLKSKLLHTRDRLIESYLWGTTIHFEPQYSGIRRAIAKMIQILTVIDDTYDNYATLGEAQLFTDVLEGRGMSGIDQLPDCMRIVYRFIVSIFKEYEREAAEQDKSFAVPYFKESVKQLGRAYNKELKWIMERQLPSFDDFITNSIVTSLLYPLLLSSIPSSKSATQQTVDWILSEPTIIISTAKLGRHLQDLGSHERESREGKMLTIIDYHMKQHGVSKQVTLSKFRDFVEDCWKTVNKEWVIGASTLPKDMVEILLNYARAAEVTYTNYADGFSYPEKKFAPIVVALFVDPIHI